MVYRIDPAEASDRAAILALVPRLRAFGEVPLRAGAVLDAGERRTLNGFFEHPSPGAQLWVARADAGTLLGFAYAEVALDYFTREPHGHLGILALSESAQGQGIGRALVNEVEAWAQRNAFRFVTLSVFAGNEHAREFYERLDFRVDTLRYIKALDGSD